MWFVCKLNPEAAIIFFYENKIAEGDTLKIGKFIAQFKKAL